MSVCSMRVVPSSSRLEAKASPGYTGSVKYRAVTRLKLVSKFSDPTKALLEGDLGSLRDAHGSPR